MTTEKWQLYSQTGVDGPEYGVRIRTGYTVVGFQKEDAQAIVAWQNASIQPEGDIMEKAKALRNAALPRQTYSIPGQTGYGNPSLSKGWDFSAVDELVRVVVLELIAEVERLRSFRGRIARILGQSPSDCDDLLIVGLDSRIILAKRLTARIKELEATKERLQSAPKSGLYGKYIIQKADGSPVDPEADYFILRLDADPVARIAALEYAIQTDDQKLGEMLEKRVMDHVFSKDDQCRKRVEGWPIGQIKQLRKQIASKDARIKELEEANRNIDKRRDEMAAFIERLEAAFLKARQCPTCKGEGTIHPIGQPIDSICPKCLGDPESMAREALERIKEGGKDE